MKQKLLVRIVCVALAVAIIGSVFLVAISSFGSVSAQTFSQSTDVEEDTDINTLRSDFVATAGTNLLRAATVAPSQGGSGYISDDYVNLRSGAGTSYSVVTCMRKNTSLTFVDGKLYNTNWYKVKLSSGASGYVHKDYVKANQTATTSTTSTGYVNEDYVNLRSGAGTNYSVVTCMRKNTKFTFVDTKLYNSSWYKIKLTNGTIGYIFSTYATKDKNNSNSNNSNNNTQTNTSTLTGYVNADYVNLRKGAGTSYDVATCMRKNTKFTFVDSKVYNSSWYKIKLSNGTVGYIYTKYATKDKTQENNSNNSTTAPTVRTGYINDDYVNLRKGAGSSYDVITCMRINTKLTFISTQLYNTNWYNVKLSDGKVGYVHKDYVTMNPIEGDNSGNTSTTFKLSDTSETIYVGSKYALTATGATEVTWSSSNTSVATVDKNGVVTAVSAGTATIKAKSGKNTLSCTITVKSGYSVNISSTSLDIPSGKSVLLRSYTSGVSWKSSNESIATVKNGIVDTKKSGYVTITAYTSSGSASCLINVTDSASIRFTYASPNSAPKNSNVTFKAITDTDKTAVKFVVSNGSTSYEVSATSKKADGDTYIWSGSRKLPTSGSWKITAYSKRSGSSKYETIAGDGEGEVFVTSSTDKTTTVCGERRASDEVIELIANYEGFLTNVTADVITSDPTLGYGKVVTTNEKFYNNLTKNEAYAYLCQTVNKGGYTSKTNSFLLENNIKFNQRQFDALVCFTYNVGAYAIYSDSDLQSVLLNTGSTSSGTIKAGASGYVNSSYVNLRSGAGTNYSVLTCMDKNTKFTFVDGKVYNSEWYKIKLTDGTVGYIYKSYASATSTSTRDLNNVDKQSFLNYYLQYHHAAGSCYWGLLYRRIDEAEVFFYGDYARDGQYNKKDFDFTCQVNPGFGI